VYLIGAIGHVGVLKVYTGGIKYPRRSLKEIIHKQNFASFKDIEKIVINDQDVFIIHLEREGEILFRAIYDEDIYDKNKFLHSIENKVKIEDSEV